MSGRHVLFVHPADEAYGADRILLGLIRGIRSRGWTASVLLPDDMPPGWLSARLREEGVPVRRGPLAVARRRYLRPLGLPRYALGLVRARRWIRRAGVRDRAAVVHINTSALLVGAILGRPGGARLVWHVHEIVLRPRALARIFRLLPVRTADRVIAVSGAVRTWLLGRDRGVGPVTDETATRVRVLHNGIPRRPAVARPPLDDRPVVVAYVGRLNRWKGYEVFVEAAALVAADRPATRFVMAGDPPPGEAWRRDDLITRIARAGMDGRIETLGQVEDGASVFEAADIAVVPSIWPDPLPTVVLEAMRAGCAVVASDLGGAPEMIEPDRSGVLVPPGDAPVLAAAVRDLVDHPDRMRALGTAARERVDRDFEASRAVEGLLAIYAEVLGR